MTQSTRTDTNRNQILGRIRAQLGRSAGQDIADHPAKKAITPKQARVGGAARVATFLKRARGVDATTAKVASRYEAMQEIKRYVTEVGAKHVHRSGDDLLDSLPWADLYTHAVEVSPLGRLQADTAVAVTGAVCGITETGTIMTASGTQHPVTLNFLPHSHVVVLTPDQVVSSYEQAWQRFHEGHTDAILPRAIHWITGPSRSADIALKPELGVHGPLRLHIVLLDE